MDRLQSAIGYLLLIGVLISSIIIATGGYLYLANHGNEIVHYQNFHEEPKSLNSIIDIFHETLSFSALAFIQIGVLFLVILQLLRVALTTWFFIKLRDKLFSVISLFILAILIYSIIWRG